MSPCPTCKEPLELVVFTRTKGNTAKVGIQCTGWNCQFSAPVDEEALLDTFVKTWTEKEPRQE